MTTDSNSLARHGDSALVFSADQRQMIRDAFANGASDPEFAVLMEIARTRRLNPLLRQIHFVKRWNNDLRRETWSAQVAIDGLRAIAQRTGLYAGQDEPEFVEGADNGYPVLCKVRVYRTDWQRPAVGVAYWREYVQTTKDGSVTKMWRQFPHVMLAKVAESIALRKAFPEDIGGLYSDAEMAQAEHPADDERAPKPAAVEQRRPAIDAAPAPLQLPRDNGRAPSGEALPAAEAPIVEAPPVEPPAPSDALKAAVGQVLRAETPDALARAFVAAEPDVKGNGDELRSLWRATKDRAAALNIARETLDAAVVRVRAETAPNDEPPTPGAKPRSRRKPTDAAGDAANDRQPPVEGPAAWQPFSTSDGVTVRDEAHAREVLRGYPLPRIVRSARLHTPAWRRLCELEAAERAAMPREVAA